MHKNVRAFIDMVGTPRAYILLLAVFAALFAWMIIPALPYSSADFAGHTNSVPALDTRIGYSPDDAYQAISGYAEDGRTYYVRRLLINDTAFPVVYSLFFVGTLALLLKRVTGQDSRLRYLVLLPMLGGALDLVENTGIMAMLLSYPARVDGVAVATGAVTAVKLSVNGITMGLIVACLVIALLRWLWEGVWQADTRK